MNKDDVDKVFNYIEENLRVTEQTSIEYLDSKGNLDRLALRQNHIIFGRRGSGKSLLLKSLKGNFKCINVNLEDYKDVSFPDSIIQVLKMIISELILTVDAKYNKFNLIKKWESGKASRKLKKKIEDLNQE
ncbi:MAG: hypothetical protein COC24_016055 [Alphaproteobacteria bacterium]|nr:hypothetical protein [Alphaproteobacteria bacterium]